MHRSRPDLKHCALCDSSPIEYSYPDINLGPYYYCSNENCKHWPIPNTDWLGWLNLNGYEELANQQIVEEKMSVIRSNVKSVEVLQVIRVTSVIGKGVDGDPIRHFVDYYTMDGVLLDSGDMMNYVQNTIKRQVNGEFTNDIL